jgi:hypothetical protein
MQAMQGKNDAVFMARGELDVLLPQWVQILRELPEIYRLSDKMSSRYS